MHLLSNIDIYCGKLLICNLQLCTNANLDCHPSGSDEEQMAIPHNASVVFWLTAGKTG